MVGVSVRFSVRAMVRVSLGLVRVKATVIKELFMVRVWSWRD